jgi:alanine racemase
MEAPSRIEVDLTAVSHNVRLFREASPGTGICAVIKADGYGLGAARLAKRLEIEGVEMLAVSTPETVRILADAAIRTPVLSLLPLPELARSDSLYRVASQGLLHQTIHDRDTLRAIAGDADRLGITLPVHLEVDTGMCRGGCRPEIAIELLRAIRGHHRLRLTGLFTHFASADTDAEFTAQQDAKFESFLEQAGDLIPPEARIHEANTFGAFRRRVYHRGMVRVGLALLGYASEEFDNPSAFELNETARKLRPVIRWESTLAQIKTVHPGERVGYGGTWAAARETTLGVVPVGYADGYPLALSSMAKVGVRIDGPSGENLLAFVPAVGRVSMDQITVDLTDVRDSVARGAKVELISRDPTAPNHLPTLAHNAGTIAHELLCRLSPRLPRSYVATEDARESAARSLAV